MTIANAKSQEKFKGKMMIVGSLFLLLFVLAGFGIVGFADTIGGFGTFFGGLVKLFGFATILGAGLKMIHTFFAGVVKAIG